MRLSELARRAAAHSFPRFVVVGSVGFMVDGGILKGLVSLAHMDPVASRFVSFPIALFCTWALNRAWSFASARSAAVLPEAGRYVMVQLTGGAVNLAIFTALVHSRVMGDAVIAPLAVAAVAGLVVNYLGARWIVFRGEPGRS